MLHQMAFPQLSASLYSNGELDNQLMVEEDNNWMGHLEELSFAGRPRSHCLVGNDDYMDIESSVY